MRFKQYFVSRRPNFSYSRDFLNGSSINELVNNPDIIEAIYIASPVFYETIEKYKNGQLKSKKEIDDFLYSFNNYLLRMSTNPIPFGLFSSIGVHNYGSRSRTDDKWRVFDLDGTIYLHICQILYSYNEILPTFKLGRNSSWNQMDSSQIKYSEKRLKNNLFEIELASIAKNEFLDELILRLNNGKKITVDEAIEIGSLLEYSESEIKNYLAQLVQNNFLTTQLTPNNIVSKFNYQRIIEVTSPILGTELEDSKIQNIAEICEILSSCSFSKNNNIKQLLRLTELIKNLGIDLNSIKSPVLVISYDNTEIVCKKDEVLDNVAESIELLLSIFDETLIQNSKMSEFEKRFHERYFDDCVKLEDALDPVHGIGYPVDEFRRVINPLVKGMPSSGKILKSNAKKVIDDFQLVLLKAILQNETNEEVNLESVDGIDSFLNKKQINYDAINPCVMLDVETEGNNEYYTLNHACFGSNTRLIGRFSLGSEDIEKIIFELNQESAECDSNRILADFSYLQKPLHINIGTAKSGLTHSIVHLNGGNDEKSSLYPQDLYLQIMNSKLVLFDIKSGKPIDIYIGNAINTSNTLDPIARFLSDYQFYKRIPAVRFSLPSITDSLSFVPRITFKGVVLSPARWLIRKKEFDTLSDNSTFSKPELLKQYMLSIKVEDSVYLIEEEERYRIEPYSDFGIRFLINKLNRKEKIILQESRISLSGNISQILLFGNREVLSKTHNSLNSEKVNFSSISHDILSISIYLKEKKNENSLLAIAEKIIGEFPDSRFFIVRYFDPMFHFRLRFVDWQNSVNVNKLFDLLLDFQKNKTISSYKIEPFRPELNRYGGKKLIKYAYDIFCDETLYVLNELKSNNEVQLISLLRRIQSYLNVYSEFVDVLQLLEKAKSGFVNEFQLTSKRGKKFLEDKFREQMPFLEVIENEVEVDVEFQKKLRAYLNGIEDNIEYTMSSLIHMLINRSISSSQRQVETIVYYSLWRYHKMKFHIKKIES